jgi:hypothetical protein
MYNRPPVEKRLDACKVLFLHSCKSSNFLKKRAQNACFVTGGQISGCLASHSLVSAVTICLLNLSPVTVSLQTPSTLSYCVAPVRKPAEDLAGKALALVLQQAPMAEFPGMG